MQSVIVEIRGRQAQILSHLTLDSEPALLNIRLHIVCSEEEKIRIGRRACGRRGQDVRIAKSGGGNLRGVEINAGDVDAVLRMRRADDDGRRAIVEDAEAAAHDRLLIGRVREAEARRDVVPVFRAADRKSTRLNSSHTVISYAVFCLKKKR